MEADMEVVLDGSGGLNNSVASHHGTIRPILQNTYFSGVTFPQLFLWNRVLFVSSLLLGLCQCLVTGLLFSSSSPENLSGSYMYLFDLWVPEVFGGLLGLTVVFYCRLLLVKTEQSAVRTLKSAAQTSPHLYIPWSGANVKVTSSMLWMLAIPAVVSWLLFGISAVSFATSVAVVRQSHEDSHSSGSSMEIVLLCLHLFILICKVVVLVFGFVVPVVILVLAKAFRGWMFLTKHVYPFVVYLDASRDARPLLIDL